MMIRAVLLSLALLAQPLWAGGSDVVETRTMTGQLLTAQEGVAPGAATLAAGVRLVMEPGWKTYWRSPGEVGLPPEMDWSGSTNIAEAQFDFPAPTRFTAFDIENFGYANEVIFPVQLRLETPGAPAQLQVAVDVLVCADVCIPESVTLSLDVPAGTGLDAGAAAQIAEWAAKVPDDGSASGLRLRQVSLTGDTLVVAAESDRPVREWNIFPEQEGYASFGKPDLRVGAGGRELWASLPVLSQGEGALQVTLTAGDRAATLPVEALGPVPAPPGAQGLWAMVLVAVLGGLILNVMPCVLPVLSIKLTGALAHASQGRGRVRAGFLASAAGVLAFFWALAAVVIGLQVSGTSVGWGMQFQNPIFLSLMVTVVALFAANLFGAFEISLPQSWSTGLARSEQRGGIAGDFATGGFAALLATPCSAPFLGTAVTYALTHGPAEIVAIFTALGVGLALPYLLIALRPDWVTRLPKPGRWMVWVKWIMGALLLATALWLLSVLAVISGPMMALALGGVLVLGLGVLAWQGRALAVTAALVLGAVALPALWPVPATIAITDDAWVRFDEANVMDRVAAGEVVFVDVTADWCLTCKANKSLVLDRGAVAEALSGVTLARADWTRPDATILAYLQSQGRYGIPFNMVYGPGAPAGIALPELLTSDAVLQALARAR